MRGDANIVQEGCWSVVWDEGDEEKEDDEVDRLDDWRDFIGVSEWGRGKQGDNDGGGLNKNNPMI